jgi:hypothetical protein
LSLREEKRNPQRNRSSGVTEVVNRVSEKRYAIRKKHNDELKQSSHEKTDETPFDSPEAAFAGRDRSIDEPVSVPVSAVPLPVLAVIAVIIMACVCMRTMRVVRMTMVFGVASLISDRH